MNIGGNVDLQVLAAVQFGGFSQAFISDFVKSLSSGEKQVDRRNYIVLLLELAIYDTL